MVQYSYQNRRCRHAAHRKSETLSRRRSFRPAQCRSSHFTDSRKGPVGAAHSPPQHRRPGGRPHGLHRGGRGGGRSCRAPSLPGQARFQGGPPACLSAPGACDPAGSTAGGGGCGTCGPVCRAGTGTSRRTAYPAGAGPPRGGPHCRCGALLVHRRAGPHQQRSVRRGRRRGLFRRQAQHRH